jgi:hypothetical protein
LACRIFTNVIDRAAIGIIAGGTIILRWIVADSCFRNTHTYIMALAECVTNDGCSAYTSSIHASVIGRAEVVVVTGGAIDLVAEATFARFRIAEGSDLALVGRRAFHIGDWGADTTGTLF